MLGEAFWKGYEAFLTGVPVGACPYPEDSPKASEWRRGWCDEGVAEIVINVQTRDRVNESVGV